MWWDKFGEVWTERSTTDPDLLIPPRSRDLWRVGSEKSRLHVDYALPVDIVCEGQCGFQRPDVAHYLCGVPRLAFPQLGLRDRARTAGEVLDLRGRCRLRAKEDRRERKPTGSCFCIESSEKLGRLVDVGCEVARDFNCEVGDLFSLSSLSANTWVRYCHFRPGHAEPF